MSQLNIRELNEMLKKVELTWNNDLKEDLSNYNVENKKKSKEIIGILSYM